MTVVESIILGIVQGLTEFLPVSSSGHLELGKALLGDDSVPQQSLIFTVVLHFATALSTLVIFRREVFRIIRGLFRFKNNQELLFSIKILMSIIPAAAMGMLFADEIENLFDKQILLVGAMLWLTGLLLYVADRAKNTAKNVSFGDALLIGVAQAIAILPGISRSGATISTSVLLGVDRTHAASFSFLMVVPLIFGKIIKDLMDGALQFESAQALPLTAGFTAAFFTGLLACKWMISLVRKSQLRYFSYYCFIVGTIAIFFTLL